MQDNTTYNMTRDADGTMHVSSALKVGGRRRPRLTDGRAHVCKCTRADGSVYYLTRTRKQAKRVRQLTQTPAAFIQAKDLPPVFAD